MGQPLDPVAPPSPGSTLRLESLDSSGFPEVTAHVRAIHPSGMPILGLTAADLTVLESGEAIPAERLRLEEEADSPLDLVLLLDRSTGEAAWASTLLAANALLEQLRGGDEVAILAFGDAVEVLSGPTEDFSQASAALVGVPVQGSGNALHQALAQALDLLGADTGARRALVVLGDGPNDVNPTAATDAPTTDALAGADLAGSFQGLTAEALAEQALAAGASVQVVAYGDGAAAPDFELLAARTGGRAVAVSAAADLGDHLEALPALLRQGYALTFASTRPADDSEQRLSLALGDGPAVEQTFIAQRGTVLVQIDRPPTGQTVSGPVVVGISSVAPAPVAGVAFTLDNGEVITSTEGPVGGIVWDSATTAPGDRQLTVTVVDTAGNSGSDTIDLVVRAPLALRVEAPAATVPVGARAVVTAVVDSAFDDAIVELFVGRTQVGMKVNPIGPAVFEIDTSDFAPGSYGIFVRAVNNSGYTVTDNNFVLTIAPPPVTVGRSIQTVWQNVRLWLGRVLPWLLGALGVLIGLLLLLWIVQRVRAGAATRAERQAEVRANLTPHVRMLLNNAGNARTRFRLRAQDSAGACRYTFLYNGVVLQPPTVARLEDAVGATNGAHTAAVAPAAAVPVTNGKSSAPAGAPAGAQPADAATVPSMAGAAAAAQNAGKAAGLAGSLFAGLGQLLPGAAGQQARAAAGQIRAQQGSVARVNYRVADTVGDVRDVKSVGGQMVGAKPGKPAAQPVPAARPPVNKAFALQGGNGAPAPAAQTAAALAPWVLTQPVAPGETIGIDIHVEPLQRMGRNKQVQFTVYSAPLDQENAPAARDEVSVRLGG